MTAVSDIQQPALETPVGEAIQRSRARVVRRLLLAFLIGLALSLLVAAAALIAWDLSYESRVLPGVRVGGPTCQGSIGRVQRPPSSRPTAATARARS